MQLPAAFIDQMHTLLGDDECARFLDALGAEPPVSVRLNEAKTTRRQQSDYEALERNPWCDTGRALPHRPAFTTDPLFHAGTYYVQESASMFVAHALAVITQSVVPPSDHAPLRVLDLCAAPGGKTTLALSVLPPDTLLVANEYVRKRSWILAENVIKWGAPNVIVTNNNAASFAAARDAFDIVLCDAPCSGEGMFRKDPASIAEWSEDNVRLCAARQRDILADVWDCLRPGGVLIYSTCTYNTAENEDNAHWIATALGAQFVPLCPAPEWNVRGSLTEDVPQDSVCRFLPHRTRGEGFFVTALRKDGDAPTHRPFPAIAAARRQQAPSVPAAVRSWVSADDCFWTQRPDTSDTSTMVLTAFPSAHRDALVWALAHLNVLHAGIGVAAVRSTGHKGQPLVSPLHSLAMSTRLCRGAFPEVALTRDQALDYLRAASLVLPSCTQRGHVLLTFEDSPLGFAKNIGARANNLYPEQWRIRNA